MMRNMNYVDCFNIWLQEEGFDGASVNTTQFNIVFQYCTYSTALCFSEDDIGIQHGKMISCNVLIE